MLPEEFMKKYPDVTFDSFKDDEIYWGYPYVRYTFYVSLTWSFEVESCTLEHCLDIANKILETVSGLNFKKNDEYLKRYDKKSDEFFEAQKKEG